MLYLMQISYSENTLASVMFFNNFKSTKWRVTHAEIANYYVINTIVDTHLIVQCKKERDRLYSLRSVAKTINEGARNTQVKHSTVLMNGQNKEWPFKRSIDGCPKMNTLVKHTQT